MIGVGPLAPSTHPAATQSDQGRQASSRQNAMDDGVLAGQNVTLPLTTRKQAIGMAGFWYLSNVRGKPHETTPLARNWPLPCSFRLNSVVSPQFRGIRHHGTGLYRATVVSMWFPSKAHDHLNPWVACCSSDASCGYWPRAASPRIAGQVHLAEQKQAALVLIQHVAGKSAVLTQRQLRAVSGSSDDRGSTLSSIEHTSRFGHRVLGFLTVSGLLIRLSPLSWERPLEERTLVGTPPLHCCLPTTVGRSVCRRPLAMDMDSEYARFMSELVRSCLLCSNPPRSGTARVWQWQRHGCLSFLGYYDCNACGFDRLRRA
jgi:hypothetical protein